MDKKVLKKFQRFVELSDKFKKSQLNIEEEVNFKDNSLNVISLNYHDNSGGNIHTPFSPPEPSKTKGEIHLENSKEEANTINEYDEYIELINVIRDYFYNLNKLNK